MNTVLIGAQWGDEGKGKVIDFLTEEADVVVRFQGGSNAGHTVVVGDKKYVLHLVPSGILHDGKHCVIGNGVVMDPFDLVKELDQVESWGFQLKGRFHISERAHMVMQWHRALDAAEEAARAEGRKIGTTGRGIGPAYAAKVGRYGMRVGDILKPNFAEIVKMHTEDANAKLRALGAHELDVDEMVRLYMPMAKALLPYVTDTVQFMHESLDKGMSVLFEGAQATMLDIDFGTYPFVTSSNPTAGGACTGSGVGPRAIDRVIGVLKLYTTRVGEGPFPTELFDADGETLRSRGGEFGATTGRPRRCGWFDAVIARYAQRVNGIDFWAMTKLDVLDTFETVKICTGYRRDDGFVYQTFPADLDVLARCEPVYEELPGWQCETSKITNYNDLPENAKRYIDRILELVGGRLGVLSVGPARETTLRIGI
ncbi:MAG: adenylosuccinate synthase [Kiritimatiellae bacterium]|jgi:adenylosuccinate synthase|nr:adenylosuccinate synthase [Kiritimatiellia bacterium]